MPQKQLEDLRLRASLTNAGDRDALLAHPDAIELPVAQIAAGGVLVGEWTGAIVGFAAAEPRTDGESEPDALFVDLNMRRRRIARSLVAHWADVDRTRESSFLYVVGNPHAREFYATCGFNMIGTSKTRFGTGLLMRMIVDSVWLQSEFFGTTSVTMPDVGCWARLNRILGSKIVGSHRKKVRNRRTL